MTKREIELVLKLKDEMSAKLKKKVELLRRKKVPKK